MPPASDHAHQTSEIYRQAAEAARAADHRTGNVVDLGESEIDDVLIAGDLHGHWPNFELILKAAAMDEHARRHLVVQEVCHSKTCGTAGTCSSFRMVERVAELSCRYSGRVHFLLGNHELAELTDYPIMKGRRLLNLAFRTGLYECYGDGADEVRRAMTTYLSSLPLAVRLGELFISHSVPANVDQSPFDHSIFEREPQPEDYFDPGPIFRLVWGRDYRPVNVRKFCDQIGAALLVNGHEPCPRGYRTPNAQQVILDCSDRPASYVILPADGRLSHRDVVEKIELVC